MLTVAGARSATRTGVGQFIATSPTTIVFAATGARSATRTGVGAFTATTEAVVVVAADGFVPLLVETAASAFDTLLVETAASIFDTLLVEVEAHGNEGIYVTVDGVSLGTYVQRNWKIARKAGARSDADFDIIAPVSALSTLPRPGSVVEARNGGPSGTLIFAGRADEPKNVLLIGSRYYDLTVRALGWRTRLDDVTLTQAQGIEIVKLATATEQVVALISILASEGFTADVSLQTPDVPDRQDMRFRAIGKILNRISELNDASVVVSALKLVSVQARSFSGGELTLSTRRSSPTCRMTSPSRTIGQRRRSVAGRSGR